MSDLKKAMDSLIQKFGKGSVYEVGNFDAPKVERIPTGSIGLDYITGGGYPKGRITEILLLGFFDVS